MFKKILATSLLIAGLSLSQASFSQDNFPNKTIRIIAPSSPGGILDLTSRLIAKQLTENLDGHAVIVENAPGGGGIIGIQKMLRAKPDGHTLVMGSLGPNAANYSLYEELPYKSSDFAPVMNVISMPSVLVVHPDLPINNIDELKAYFKDKGEEPSMAIATIGASSHLIGQLLQNELDMPAVDVVYKGAAPAITDLASGQVSFMIDNMITALPLIKSGKVKAIATFTEERNDLLPDISTVAEQGYPELVGGTWIGLLVSADTPKDRVQKLNELLNEAIENSEIISQIEKQGGVPEGGSPDKFAQFIQSETDRWSKVIEEGDIKIK